ncbi:MAG TPA: energy transducer TonB [Desulfuromonadales bacterium]|nr:energy transducer TonB [Desulfuromonadales bacterium]
MNRRNSYNTAFSGFIIISLLVHLLALYLFQGQSFISAPAEPEERTYVEVREPQPPRERELDVPPPSEPEERETPARRLGPADQVVPQEEAPEGKAPEDRAPPPVPPQVVKPEPKTDSSVEKSVEKPAEKAKERQSEQIARPDGERPPPAEESQKTEAQEPDSPDIEQLTRLAPDTVARMQAEQLQNKNRRDVEQGEAVRLDMEEDLLWSFFNRLRDNIYLVWQYPSEARQQRLEGTCLVEMVIDSEGGTVRSVEVVESSGSNILDQEAVEAVRKGAPYGDLPRAYEKDHIKVLANFRYTLNRRVIY